MQPSATLPLALGPTDGDITNTITVLSLPSGQATYVLATFNGTAAGIVEFDPMGTPARISYFPAPAASFPTQSAKSLAVGYGVLSGEYIYHSGPESLSKGAPSNEG